MDREFLLFFLEDSTEETGVIGIETFDAARNAEMEAAVTARLHSCGISDRMKRGWISRRLFRNDLDDAFL